MTDNPLTVVMYHYVRPLARSRFPAIKGLDLDAFRGQIDYIRRHYQVVRMEEVAAALDGGRPLPPRAALLTFDDGYADHFRYAFPVLAEHGMQGSFYAPRSTALERDILDVNKIHFILAAVTNHAALAAELTHLVDAARTRFALLPDEELRRLYWAPNRFDPAEVNFTKRLLQHALPLALRDEIATELFARHVAENALAFSEELYMSLDQMRLMARAGMHFGGHGDRHLWMSRATPAEQEEEARGAAEVLDLIGVPQDLRTYCYPYGDYDAACIRLLEANGFRIAFTAKPELALPGEHGRFELPRVDTNDLPKESGAAPNDWTARAAGNLPT